MSQMSLHNYLSAQFIPVCSLGAVQLLIYFGVCGWYIKCKDRKSFRVWIRCVKALYWLQTKQYGKTYTATFIRYDGHCVMRSSHRCSRWTLSKELYGTLPRAHSCERARFLVSFIRGIENSTNASC